MTLYHKYRPADFDAMVGNEETVASLKSLLTKNDRPHSYLLHGPTGCGKTTLGRILARELGASGMDLSEIDSADFRGIDTIRAIRQQSQFRPLESPSKVWLMDESHKLSGDAQSALLKILEDAPKHVYFILCTTDPHKLLPTIRGRCNQFQVAQLNERQMLRLLVKVVKAEGVSMEKQVYGQIVQDSLGHPRNALQILEQVIGVEPAKRLDAAKRIAAVQSQSIELCRALISKANWPKVSNILQGLREQDPESIRRHVLGYCDSALLKGGNNQAAFIMECFIEPFYNTGWPGLTFACYSVVEGRGE